ncbi:MAG: phosphoethanolamine transferase [Dysgonamonadaceae bacterium]|jgi:glucan phosphoethanolaminetransferase (alkaline phosphatase superfamily)|nr:phosphoethanolamine transferase [Dysgonamonadaceae bacterium]
MTKKNNLLPFVVLSALFIGITFTASDFLTSPADSVKDSFILFLQWTVLFFALLPPVYILALNKYVFAGIFPPLCIVSGVLTYFRYTAGTVLTTEIIEIFMDNHSQSTVMGAGLYAVVAAAGLVSVLFAVYRFKKIKIRKTHVHLSVATAAAVLIFSIPQIKRPVANRLPFNLYFVTKDYIKNRREYMTERPGFDAVRCSDDSLAVVLVIGESLRPDHLGINGYERNTTPHLAEEDIIPFPDVQSPYTYTNASLAYMLTRADSLHPDRAAVERSFVDLFKKCGFHTSWLANQAATKGYVYFMKECDTLIYCVSGKSSYVFDRTWTDAGLLPAFDAVTGQGFDRQLVVLHTVGSHWYYNTHCEDSLKHFAPVTRSRIISSNTKQEMINSYDNTVLSTDLFIYNLINRLRDKNAVLIYLSDHGEALGENGQWLHASDSPAVHNTACLVWLSPAYIALHADRYEALMENRLRRYDTDFLFHTIIECADIGFGDGEDEYRKNLFRQ